ncbi:protein of unknown function [Klenkia marina]|uniref:DUF4192 domain-containing protein n=1 Tax=Klenkia marina TaxID=1960309 RepID=A0A1G4YU70_9ACTN|nr:DUF4192 domain-containing protein [Klenkia marina]SCX56973.1 protein of unknown function [Klenkia marina]
MAPHASPDDLPITLAGGAELAAALPYLIGFVPHESLVLVALTGDHEARVGVTLRVDLPAPGPAADVVAEAVARLGPSRPAAVAALVVTEADDVPAPVEAGADLLDRRVDELDAVELRALRTSTDLPGRAVVGEVARVLAGAGVPLLHTLLVRAGRCWDYDCPDACCDPGAGEVLPGGTSRLAAATVLDGRAVAADRDEVVTRLAPPTGAALLAMGRACAQVGVEQADDLRRLGWDRLAERSWRRVLEAVARHRPGTTAALTDVEVARLGWAVTAIEVRDRALRLSAGPSASAAEAVWTELVRRLPVPLDATPATLLAAAAHVRGDGATAAIALSRALDSQPACTLARLLERALHTGFPPSALRGLLTRAGEQAGAGASEQLGA